MLGQIAESIPVEGMESLAPARVDWLVPLTHYMPADAAVAVVSSERVATRAVSLLEATREFLSAAWNAATVGDEAPIDLDAGDVLTLGGPRASVVDVELIQQRIARGWGHSYRLSTTLDKLDSQYSAGRACPDLTDEEPRGRGEIDQRVRENRRHRRAEFRRPCELCHRSRRHPHPRGLDGGDPSPTATASSNAPPMFSASTGSQPARSRRFRRMLTPASRSCSRHPSKLASNCRRSTWSSSVRASSTGAPPATTPAR